MCGNGCDYHSLAMVALIVCGLPALLSAAIVLLACMLSSRISAVSRAHSKESDEGE